ncbi:pleckstrin domain-containing protein [Heterostelium album PN500]|uniref:Pleckstrin domain-containing protein n=1 Tax=Heterostelium pallidum (strain ATCC 26659 / Pp 5 / PN500) TaxID=670386 RepID=D3BBU2_HETP5|nr:pleckstrin domain-containing protein [Heterostelium album PN500]EFA81125.1 pleckstrin domain-containing protein [Heterostelium album PN500]|eukprot:XP_020433243.1 pleckstrin domain-containing protein [Heterostelium album PN500]
MIDSNHLYFLNQNKENLNNVNLSIQQQQTLSPSKPLSPMAMSPPQTSANSSTASLPIPFSLNNHSESTIAPTNHTFLMPLQPISMSSGGGLENGGASGSSLTLSSASSSSLSLSSSMIMPPPSSLSSSSSTLMGPPPPLAYTKRYSNVFETVSRSQTTTSTTLAPPTPQMSSAANRHSKQMVRRSVKIETSDLNERCREERRSAAISKQASKRDLTIFLSRQKSELEMKTERKPEPTPTVPEQVKKRLEAIKELLTSENTYLNHLNTIVDIYLLPLRRDYSAPEEVKFIVSIFSNIEVIRDANKNVLALLSSRINSSLTNDTVLSDVLFKFIPTLEIYKEYYVNWYRSLHNLDQWLAKCKKIKKFIDDKSLITLNLKSLLIMPCQRIPRYTLLIDAILQYTNPLHPDYVHLQNAMSMTKKLTESINERIRDSEKTQLVTNIRLKFDDSIGFLDEIHRRLVKESSEFQLLPCKNISQINDHYVNNDDDTDEEDYSSGTKKKKNQKLIPSDCNLYLFNDLFVIGVPSQQITTKQTALLKATLATTIFKEYPQLPLKFSIHHNSGTYFFNAASRELKEQFVKECNEAIELLIKDDVELQERRKKIRLEGSDEEGWNVFDPEVVIKYPMAQKALEELNQMQTQIFTPKKRKSVVGKLKERTRSFLSPHKTLNVRRSSSFLLNSLESDVPTNASQ